MFPNKRLSRQPRNINKVETFLVPCNELRYIIATMFDQALINIVHMLLIAISLIICTSFPTYICEFSVKFMATHFCLQKLKRTKLRA